MKRYLVKSYFCSCVEKVRRVVRVSSTMGRIGVLIILLIFSLKNCFCIYGGFFGFFEALNNLMPPMTDVMIENSRATEMTDSRIELFAGDEKEISAKVTVGLQSSTAFEIFAPPQFKIKANCEILCPSCNETVQALYIEKERTSDHSSGISHTGFLVEETSLFNYMRIQLNSENGEFLCRVKAIEADCDCGWSRQV